MKLEDLRRGDTSRVKAPTNRICVSMTRMAKVLAASLLLMFGATVAIADELFPQGPFDDASSAEGWLLNYGPGYVEFEPDRDHNYCPRSGGLVLRNTSNLPSDTYSVWKCLGPLPAHEPLEAGISALFREGQASTELHLVITYYSGPDCSGNLVGNPNGGFYNYLPFGWRSDSFTATPPASAESFGIVLFFFNSNLEGTAEVLIDDVYLRSSRDIFSGDFEQGTRCRWSTSFGPSDN